MLRVNDELEIIATVLLKPRRASDPGPQLFQEGSQVSNIIKTGLWAEVRVMTMERQLEFGVYLGRNRTGEAASRGNRAGLGSGRSNHLLGSEPVDIHLVSMYHSAPIH